MLCIGVFVGILFLCTCTEPMTNKGISDENRSIPAASLDRIASENLLPSFDSLNGTNAEKKAIIIIPAVAVSELYTGSKEHPRKIWLGVNLFDARCDANGQPVVDSYPLDDSVSPYGAFGIYKKLVDLLHEKNDKQYGRSREYEVRFFSYDWRLSCQNSARRLDQFIKENGYSRVVLVAHSLGGIVASYYMAENGYDKIEKFISIGTPFFGAPKTLHTFEDGKLFNNRFANLFHVDDAIVKKIAPNTPALYELLPNKEFFREGNGYIYRSQNEPLDESSTWDFIKERPWCNDALYEQAQCTYAKQYEKNTISGVYSDIQNNVVDFYLIAGYGRETVTGLSYDEDGFVGTVKGDGDGSVPLYSATMGHASFKRLPYFVENVKHSKLAMLDGMCQLIWNLIEGQGDSADYAAGCEDLTISRTVEIPDTA